MPPIKLADFIEINPPNQLQRGIVYDFVPMDVIAPGIRYVVAEEKREYTGGGTKFRNGDVLFARITPCLENGKIAQFVASDAGFGSTEFIVMRSREGVSDQAFVFYLALSSLVRQPAEKSMSGASGRQRASTSVLAELKLHLPELPTQRKIAAILSAYDDLIANNMRRIHILEHITSDLYQEWFVHFRFPGHESVVMVDSGTEYGMIPQGWKVLKLSDLVSTQYGYTESSRDEQVGPRYLRGMDINKSSYIDWSSIPYCPIEDDDYENYRLVVGDVLVIRMADPGKVGIVEQEIDAVFASYLIRLRILEHSITPYYLFYFLNSEKYQGYISGASTGTTRKSASAGVITDINIIVPDKETMDAYTVQIQGLRQMLTNLLNRNTNLRLTRDLLLPRLISSELDVSELDIDVPEPAAGYGA